MRDKYQGIKNVIRFNYPYYAVALTAGALLLAALPFVPSWCAVCFGIVSAGSLYYVLASVLVSHWVYDRSNLYTMEWLDQWYGGAPDRIANVHAGFDETSGLLQSKFPGSSVTVFDFYDPQTNTEASIARARASAEGVLPMRIGQTLPQKFHAVFLLLAAHEIRTSQDRVHFLEGLRQSLEEGGVIILVEHLRNTANFLAFGPGFFHFFSASTWERDFALVGLHVRDRFAITPFLRGYVLQ